MIIAVNKLVQKGELDRIHVTFLGNSIFPSAREPIVNAWAETNVYTLINDFHQNSKTWKVYSNERAILEIIAETIL